MTTNHNVVNLHGEQIELPTADNTSEALKVFRAANAHFRTVPWPEPFDRTTHSIKKGDARGSRKRRARKSSNNCGRCSTNNNPHSTRPRGGG